MRKTILSLLIALTSLVATAQTTTYRAEKEKEHKLIHTKLKVDFNFQEQKLNGEEWLTATPYFYATNKITLDAKAMLIHEVKMNNRTLDYNYDNLKLIIDLGREYKRNEEFTIYLKYTAQPEKVKQKGSAAITQAKGLYFINPTGLDKNKPTQIWTQGETEANSCWFPTIDSPNQKTSQEIYITVPDKFKTLSNGKLVSQTKNGTNRTDYWKLDEKHAPYLFFMGVGEYEIVREQNKNLPISYYVSKEYAPYAKEIFGHTAEMIGFFGDKLGVEYPWNKYDQIVGVDYVSGAMENTTAVIHGEKAYQKPGQLIDQNVQENTIAHEVFHHWFGNLVTTESWSNLALNESFASYSEYLWREYKYGVEDADAHLLEDVEGYKNGQNFDKHLIRFDYADKEDMFDAVSYNKGGAILHMLRSYLGDDAFYTGLKKYLTDYKYKAAEAHQLRLTLEEVSGRDLNWFFNQWFFGNGHPKLEISYDYNKLQKTVTVNIIQLQQGQEFKFPFAIDIFEGNKATRHTVFVNGKDASFILPYNNHPDLIQVNADGVLVSDIVENKVLSDYIHQLKYAKYYGHKKEALLEVAKKQDDKIAFNAIANAMSDDFYKIRILALENIDLINKHTKKAVISKIKQIANNDVKTLVQAAAVETLGKLTDPELQPIFEKALQSKSYSVIGKGLVGLYYVDKKVAIEKSKAMPDEIRKVLATPLTRIFIEEKDESELPFVAKHILSGMFLTNIAKDKAFYQKAFEFIAKSDNTEAIQNLVDDVVVKGNQYKQYGFDKVGVNLLRQMVQFQGKANHSSRNKNEAIIKEAMAKLLQ
ncbi:M1 family metallopeptidase [Tenacibaculum aquimarinum]|uniref:M1 family metallopeptidase n=1 Tax=Tenacibaculum aquimarinum TaxID=2910675 RepID=UPI001F0A8D46|nr:M1 family metallopeptidase [Tenacibaculum aquimarinum]MCH3885237.1 M1 family metallopeptidase [Tenacibaculum aquimarinum]